MASSQQRRRKSPIPGCCKLCYQDHDGVYTIHDSLKNACKTGHLACLEALLTAGADVNGRYLGYFYLDQILAFTISQKNYDCVEALIKAGAEITIAVLGETGKKGNERCVNLILEAGGNPQVMMYYAAKAGRCDIVELLIQSGADVNKDGYIVLAAASGSLKCVNRLLQAGADVNGTAEHKNMCRTTALIVAAETNSIEIVKLLIKIGADVNKQDDSGCTALFGAIKSRSSECAALLLKAGADVNIRDVVALITAASDGSVKCINLLLQAGADVNIRDRKGKTALVEYVYNGSGECTPESLLQAGADVNMVDDDGKTALFTGAGQGSVKYVNLLLKAGADVNIRDNEGETALFEGVYSSSTECTIELLKVGADVNTKDNTVETALFKIVENGSREWIDLFLKAGADVNVISNEGNTVLHRTMYNFTGVKKMLQEGVKVNVRNNNGLNALTHFLRQVEIEFYSYCVYFESIKRIVMLYFAAGESVDETRGEVPDYLKPSEDINLMNICREAIRTHLLQIDDVNLFLRGTEASSSKCHGIFSPV